MLYALWVIYDVYTIKNVYTLNALWKIVQPIVHNAFERLNAYRSLCFGLSAKC